MGTPKKGLTTKEKELLGLSQRTREVDPDFINKVNIYLLDVADSIINYADYVVRREFHGGMPLNMGVEKNAGKGIIEIKIKLEIPTYVVDAIIDSEEILAILMDRLEKRLKKH